MGAAIDEWAQYIKSKQHTRNIQVGREGISNGLGSRRIQPLSRDKERRGQEKRDEHQ